ncbi:MAG: flagellar motor switch protein FliM [Verrucomicrobiota bacterium]|jgi:flagellar motor switch protein FliM
MEAIPTLPEETNASSDALSDASLPNAASSVRPHDFRRSAILPAREMRKLRQRQEEFVRAVADRLTLYLRLDFTVELNELQTISYQKLINSFPTPTHLTLFKLEPLRGVCLLDIAPRLGLALVDRLLGGPAMPAGDRDLSEIEVALLDQIVHILLDEWGRQWNDLQPLQPELLGHENNACYLQSSPGDTTMLLVKLQTKFGENSGLIQFAFPYYTVEPLLRQLAPAMEKTPAETAPAPAAPVQWNPAWDDISVSIVAEWNALELTARELASLKPGDVIQLTPQCVNQVQLRLADIPKYRGRLGTSGKQWAVEVTEILKPK